MRNLQIFIEVLLTRCENEDKILCLTLKAWTQVQCFKSIPTFSTVISCQITVSILKDYSFFMRINRFLEIQVQVKVLFTFHFHVERILIIGSFISFFSLCPRHDRWSLSSSRRATQPSRRSASRPCSRLPSDRTLSASFTMRSPRTAGSLTQSAKLLVCRRFLWHLLFKVSSLVEW